MDFIYKLLGIAVAAAEGAPEAGNTVTDAAGAVVDAATQNPEQAAGCVEATIGSIGMFFPLIIMFALMYFLMIRPEKKRKKKEQEMLNALKRGDRICTIGGIYGTIMDIKDDTITLSVGRDNLSMVVTRWAIRSVEDATIENESEALN